MDRAEECVCCLELTQIVSKKSEVSATLDNPPCITQNPGFSAVCLNKWVLQTAAWYQYYQQS